MGGVSLKLILTDLGGNRHHLFTILLILAWGLRHSLKKRGQQNKER